MENFYRIAGLTVAMDTFGTTQKQAETYRCAPVDAPDIVLEKGLYKIYQEQYPFVDDDISEYMMTGGHFYRQLLLFGGFMLHSSAVVVDGRAYLFSADPGTGKSTHTQLWLHEFDGAYILNDDKPALRREADGWFAYGTPWSGKTDWNVPERVALGGIALVERGETNTIVPCGGSEAVRGLMKQVNRPKAAEYRIRLMELMDKLIAETPVWKLRCNMQPEAAHVAYEAMRLK